MAVCLGRCSQSSVMGSAHVSLVRRPADQHARPPRLVSSCLLDYNNIQPHIYAVFSGSPLPKNADLLSDSVGVWTEGLHMKSLFSWEMRYDD